MVRPPALKHGDKVIIVSPSRMITHDQIQQALEVLSGWGLTVELASGALDQYGYFAGTDDVRLSNLQQAIELEEYKAVFCSRGGYGMTRIIDALDVSCLSNHPKWIVGFSDITALHLKVYAAGVESIHGVMPVQFDYDNIGMSVDTLKDLLFGAKLNYHWSADDHNVIGSASGTLIGGNLSLLTESLGTPTEVNTDGSVLFIEEIDEYYYKLDRMLNQLKRAGKFDKIKGLIIGQFSDLKDTQIPFGQSLPEIVKHYMPPSLDIPICFNAPFGHTADNWALPCGRYVELVVEPQLVTLKE